MKPMKGTTQVRSYQYVIHDDDIALPSTPLVVVERRRDMPPLGDEKPYWTVRLLPENPHLLGDLLGDQQRDGWAETIQATTEEAADMAESLGVAVLAIFEIRRNHSEVAIETLRRIFDDRRRNA